MISPPTDNFYKFVAVSCLILLLAAIYVIVQKIDSEDALYYRQFNKEKILENEINSLKDELEYSTRYKSLNDSINNFIDKSQYSDNAKDSIYKVLIFNLPDSIKNKFKQFALKKEELAISRGSINNQLPTNSLYFYVVLIGLYIAEVFAMYGLMKWYYNVQKPIDDEQSQKHVQKLLEEEYWVECCQSCLKSFFFKSELGKEKDGSINKLFCNECYSNGEYVEPELTYDDAYIRLETSLKKLKYSWLQRRKKLKKLKLVYRWYRKTTW